MENPQNHPILQLYFLTILRIFSYLVKSLLDVRAGPADHPDGEEEVVVEELLRNVLDGRREGGAEHQRLPLLLRRHLWVRDDPPDIGDEAHVEHLVALVQHQALDVGETPLEHVS